MRLLLAAAAAPLLLGLAATAVIAAGGPPADPEPPANAPDTRTPNGASIGQKPAFAGQTRAPGEFLNVKYDVTLLTSGLFHPWGMAFLPDGSMLVGERDGKLRIISKDGKTKSEPATGLPALDTRVQGGLLDIKLDPQYRANNLVWFSYSEPREGGNGTAVAKAKLVTGPQPKLENLQVLYREMPTLQSTLHYGSRIVFAPDGTVYITQGERSIEAGRTQAQDLQSDFGKIVRINKDGSIPKDNPYADGKGGRPEIFDRGHRNVQAADIDPVTKKLYTVEHGTRGGDELNQPEKGKDYGWPTIAYGIEYSGGAIRGGVTRKEGMEQPLYYWDPVIAPGGMTFYTGSMFPKWKNSLFIGSLKSKWLVRLTLKNNKVVGEEWLLRDLNKRIRLPVQGPDGALYVITDEDNGEIYRISAAK